MFCKIKCDRPIAIVALFVVPGCRLHFPPFALEMSFFALFLPALCHLTSFLTVSEIEIFVLSSSKNNTFIENGRGTEHILSCPGGHVCFSTRKRMLLRAILRNFFAGNLLACTLGTTPRAVKKPFRASLRVLYNGWLDNQCNLSRSIRWRRPGLATRHAIVPKTSFAPFLGG